MNLVLVLRLVGVTHLALGLAHVPMWRLFDWSREIAPLSPLTRRVFLVHTFFIVFVLVALGALTVVSPELLVDKAELARLLLGAGAVFWLLRLVAQLVIFDPVLLREKSHGWLLRSAATMLFALYVVVYGWALSKQFG